jgi:hypothetical protein
MSAATGKDWREGFGVSGRKPPEFFHHKDDLEKVAASASQAHALRRAFDTMKLDGIACLDGVPMIYFREMARIEAEAVRALLRQFWNQGIAPILVLISGDEIHIYSSLAPTVSDVEDVTKPECLVTTLNRVSDAADVARLVLSVESGEFFRANAKAFDPSRRVDRELLRNLRATREEMDNAAAPKLKDDILDALLCRLVFTCYLFDRGVIKPSYLDDLGVTGIEHLRDVLALQPWTEAKQKLYALFRKLGGDFNGDLFSDDLDKEEEKVGERQLEILNLFFHGTDVQSRQARFWPYNFRDIPIETISAIYEHFLKAADAEAKHEDGAFYTPRFLAELVLDVALEGAGSLLDKRFLDPSCGSGIFLVGLFNRLAEEWKRANPQARYDRRARELMGVLKNNLFGVDKNKTACRIASFSLYLAFLDQLAPPDIEELQRKKKVLPKLLWTPKDKDTDGRGETILCADFFSTADIIPRNINIVVGNPPWARVHDGDTDVAQWCVDHEITLPGKQLAAAFICKAPRHLVDDGRVCLVLPHGLLFNHKSDAVEFQADWVKSRAIDVVLNLVDYQRFLFEESEAPALVVRFRKEKPTSSAHRIRYWAPKTDWRVSKAEVIRILPQDRSEITVKEILSDLRGDDAPLVWKRYFWATPRDWRLLDRLSLLPRLRDMLQRRNAPPGATWTMAQGFEERKAGAGEETKDLELPTRRLFEAPTTDLNLFLLEDDCGELPSKTVTVRTRSNTKTKVYESPHVLITNSINQSAYADFAVAFRHAVRGIHGGKEDRELLIFLAAYIHAPLARYFLFHTSSNWGISRAKVHVEELVRLPFARPESMPDAKRSAEIVKEVAGVVITASRDASKQWADRDAITNAAKKVTSKLVAEYFDVSAAEAALIEDTNRVIIPSTRPTRQRLDVPTLTHAIDSRRKGYTTRLLSLLNQRAAKSAFEVHGEQFADEEAGVGMVVLEKARKGEEPKGLPSKAADTVAAVERLQRETARSYSSFELTRGVKVFHKSLLLLLKPLGERFWTNTAALNDADEIAQSIAMKSERVGV